MHLSTSASFLRMPLLLFIYLFIVGYCLSKKESRLGTPERPLSALGALTYKRYWAHTVRLFLHSAAGPVRMEGIDAIKRFSHVQLLILLLDICRATSMTMEDVYNTLQDLKYIIVQDRPCQPSRPPPGTPIKYIRGRKIGSGIARRALSRMKKDENKDQLIIPTEYQIVWDHEEVDSYAAAWKTKDQIKINPKSLKWSPFILAKVPKTAVVEDPSLAPQGHVKPESASSRPPMLDGTSTLAASLRDIALSEPDQQPNAALRDGGEESRSGADTRSASAMEVDEELLTHVSDTSRKSRTSTSWTKSERSNSREQRQSGSAMLETSRLRTLRPRLSAQGKGSVKPDEGDQALFSENSDDAGDANQNQFRRVTRSAGRLESPKAKTLPHKRRRIETSSSTDTEDADGSLSALTHGSSSPPTPSPPRRSTRSEKTKVANQNVSGTLKKTDIGRVTRSHPQAAEILVSSPNADDISVPKEFERRNTRRTRQAVHVHSEADAECIPVNESAPKMVDVDMADTLPEEPNNQVMSSHILKPAVFPTNGVLSNGSTPGMFHDEDGLGDEDAEGEDDLDPSDDY